MEFISLIQAGVLFVGMTLTFALLRLAYSLFQGNKGEYELNRSRCGTFKNIIMGNVSCYNGGQRDFRVKAGIAVNQKTNKWVSQGTLSDEAIDSIISQ